MTDINGKHLELPEYIAEYLCDLLEINTGSSVFIYSHGTNIMDAICRRNPKALYNAKNQAKESINEPLDRAVLCIPFSDNIDIGTVQTMYETLESGGMLVGLVNLSLFYTNNGTVTDFANFLIANNATIKDLPKDAFTEIGEDVNACMIKIIK